MKKTIFLIASFICLVTLSASAQQYNFKKETFKFAEKNGQELFLDKYVSNAEFTTQVTRPCVIFMFGGAFARGTRDRADYMPYFEWLVNRGYTVVSIDYRLGLKDFDPNTEMTDEEFIMLLHNTIRMAVDDLYDATNYVVEHAGHWNIDTGRIIANGSSAGAVSVLQAEYELCNRGEYVNSIPADFNYLGVISFAGAIFKFAPQLRWATMPCPIQMFHGDADKQVPYGAVIEGGAGFFGSKYVAESLRAIDSPYYFYSVENASHIMSSEPFSKNLNEIATFLDKFVIGDQKLMIDCYVTDQEKPEVFKDFTIFDYISGNYIER